MRVDSFTDGATVKFKSRAGCESRIECIEPAWSGAYAVGRARSRLAWLGLTVDTKIARSVFFGFLRAHASGYVSISSHKLRRQLYLH